MSVEQPKKKIVTIGGGTGTFVVLSGLKQVPGISLHAIVSVADDGGSTGRLRDAYGFLPMGDARRALVALSKGDDPSLIRSLFEYRFAKGDVAGHNFGNLLLTALTDILESPAKAIEAASSILRVTGYVVPVSEKPVTLVAHLENGEVVRGESAIDTHATGRSPIASLTTVEDVPANPAALEAIRDAALIILGPGDIYTSIVPNLAIRGMKEAVSTSSAKLVYVVNLFTKTGQTEDYSASAHVREVTKYAGRSPDIVIMNTSTFPSAVLEYYQKAGEHPVHDDLPSDASVVRGAFADAIQVETAPQDKVSRSLIRHDSEKLSEVIQSLL